MAVNKLVVAAIALAWVVTACSISPIQAGAPTAPGQTGTVVPQQAKAGVAATESPDAVTIGSKGPVVGVNLYAVHNYTTAQTTADGERTLAYIKNNLHASAVDLVWNLYTTTDSSDSVVTSQADTLPASNIAILTRIAQRDGLYVEYRPMLFVEIAGNNWEGKIKPIDPDAWFNSYYEANLPYLKVAQQYHINEYVVGTEMNDLTPDPQWSAFLAKCAQVFSGQISYTQNQYMYFPPVTELPPTELTGVDMYEPLRAASSAPLATVASVYEAYFAEMPSSLLRRTAIQETGIEARFGAYADPPNLGRIGPLDEAIQYNWFMAGCETVKRFHLRGIFFWKVDLADYPVTHPASSLSTFEGRSGAVAISKCASIIKG